MFPQGSLNEKRHFRRIGVDWTVSCHIGEHSFEAIAKDAGTNGAFLRPTDVDMESWLKALTQSNWRMSLELQGNRSVAQVRWMGFSREHGCKGFGVQFLR